MIRTVPGAVSSLLRWFSVIACVASATGAVAITPDDPGAGDVLFTVDSSSHVRAISPYIYGVNQLNAFPSPAMFNLSRLGGNRWTGYNWETNASNAGKDWFHSSDYYLVNAQHNTPPGQAVRPALELGATNGNGVVVTVPIAGYVAADAGGTVDESEAAPSVRWRELVAKKSTVSALPLSVTPDENDPWVFTDEFVHWVQQTKQPGQTVFFGFDNEPGLWDNTHPRIVPGGNPTFEDLRHKTIAHAGAIKDVAPDALVFGPTGFGWSGFERLHDAPDFETQVPEPRSRDGLHFNRWFLDQIAAEEAVQGRRLVDVLDLHWYPEARGDDIRITAEGALDNSPGVVAARVQAPRSLWDPTYRETSWITRWKTQGPIELLNRVHDDVEQLKPGTKVAITEYNYGGGNHISGAIAQADVLGVFGREDVFAATWWNIEGYGNLDYTNGAFQMFRDFDGTGDTFGDTSVQALTDDIEASSVYASLDTSDPDRMVLVAINRSDAPLDVAMAVTHDRRFDVAQVYQLTASGSAPVRGSDVPIDLVNAFHYTMPAWSVSTLLLLPAEFQSDFDLDGDVDGDDFLAWQSGFGTGRLRAEGDADRDGGVDGDDFLIWQKEFGSVSGDAAATAVPEPASLTLLVFQVALWIVLHVTRGRIQL